MSDSIPELEAVKMLLHEEYFSVWEKLCAAIEAEYEMERLWNSGGKSWTYDTNTGVEVRHCVHCMQERTVWDSW